MRVLLKVLLLSLIVPAVWAQAPVRPDAKGCTANKVVTRMPGCFIASCQVQDYNVADMPRSKAERDHKIEGQFEQTKYVCQKDKSALELGRQTENALKNAGFKIYYTDVYYGGSRFWMTAQKGAQWVRLVVVGEGYDLITVKEKQMDQVLTADADGWAKQINESGRVSLYGINFDTAKSTIRPDSEPVLTEVAKMLKANPDWAMVVAGHTDNVGAKASNLTLSRQRAQSVIAWLSKNGIEEARLVPAGFGDTRPIADNKDDAGKQQNRRVDLVKVY